MKKLHLIVVFFAAGSAACGASAVAEAPSGPEARLRIMGLVTEIEPKGTYAYVGLERVMHGVESTPVHAKLPLVTATGQPEPIEVRELAVRIEVLQRVPEYTKYDVLLGPELCGGSSTKYLCANTDDSGSGWVGRCESMKLFEGATVFHLERGWALLWSNPTGTGGETEWVIGGTQGSTMIIRIVDAATQHVYFVDGDEITVQCKLNPSLSEVCKQPNKYLKVTKVGETCIFDGWHSIGVGSDEAKFVEEVLKMATVAGKKQP